VPAKHAVCESVVLPVAVHSDVVSKKSWDVVAFCRQNFCQILSTKKLSLDLDCSLFSMSKESVYEIVMKPTKPGISEPQTTVSCIVPIIFIF
jgi:hypothetical protein